MKNCHSDAMRYTFTVQVETDNIIGTKEAIAAALESYGKITFPKVERGGKENEAQTGIDCIRNDAVAE